MTKFHINPKTGNPGACSAKVGKCPFGDLPHYATENEARRAYENQNSGSFVDDSTSYVEQILNDLPEIDYTGQFETVGTSWGDTQEANLGELSDANRWLLTNGQSLGFAKELASAFKTNSVAVHHRTVIGDELLWDDETDDFALDADGEEIWEEHEVIQHAYAVAPDGSYWDGGGKEALDEINLAYRGSITEYDTNEAYDLYKGQMVEQNEKFSKSLVRPVLLAEKTKHERKFKAPVPKTFFHITSKVNLHNIQKQGLKPVIGANSHKINEEEPKVYLFDSRESVVQALTGWLGDEFDEDEELVLLSVPSTAVQNSTPSFDDPQGSWEWSTSDGISADSLTVEPDKL